MSSEASQLDGPQARGASVRSSPGPGPDQEHPIGEMVRIALPAVVTMLSYVVMQFVDTLIVSRLGAGPLSAVGNGGVAAFVIGAVVFGTLGVINTYASQNLGAGRPERAGVYAWAGLWIDLIVWLAVMLPLTFALPHLFRGMRAVFELHADPVVAQMESEYGRVLLAGMVFTIAARGVAHFFYGVHRASTVMVAAIVGNVINIPLSWALVMGDWGFPQMGVAGAALGTVVGSAIEAGILIAVMLSPTFDRAFRTRSSWRFNWPAVRDILRLGWPGGLQLGNELICWWVFMSGLIAHFGVAHNAAGWITLRYMHVSFMPAVGLSMAVTAVVGKKMGQGLPDVAAARAWLGVRMAMIYMGTCALAFVIFREQLAGVFVARVAGDADPQDVLRVASMTLILAAGFQVFDALAIVIIAALRGAGDTVWPGVATAIASWVFVVGGGWLAVRFWPGAGSLGPWASAAMYIITLSLTLLARFRGGRWRTMSVVGHETRIGPEDIPVIPPQAGAGVVPESIEAD